MRVIVLADSHPHRLHCIDPAGPHVRSAELSEQPRKCPLAVLEDPAHIADNDRTADEPRTRHELHAIDDTRAAIDRLEAVLVVPPSVRPAHLAIHEADPWLPHVDARQPWNRDAI